LANLREIRRHIRTVRNIAQITRAMEMVSVSKMRRAEARVLTLRPYVARALRVLSYLAALRADSDSDSAALHPLLQHRPVKSIGLLLITASRGFCGALNHAVIQVASDFVLKQSVPVVLVTVGSKGRDYMLRYGQHILAEFAAVADEQQLREVGTPVTEILVGDFERGFYDEVYMVYASFVSALVQRVTLQKLLPVEVDAALAGSSAAYVYYEPDRQQLLGDLVPRFVEWQAYLALAEAMASEHSARMVIMHEATHNATEMLEDLMVAANRARQKAITEEVVEVTEGAVSPYAGDLLQREG
jgi:F-type H+-transporting ATPase subunit gamma